MKKTPSLISPISIKLPTVDPKLNKPPGGLNRAFTVSVVQLVLLDKKLIFHSKVGYKMNVDEKLILFFLSILVAGLIDSMIYHSARALQKKIELGKAN